MQWVPLNNKRLRAASYDTDRQKLLIKTSRGSILTHEGVLPHMFDNLVSSDDKVFYYRIYLETSLVSDRRGAGSVAKYVLKMCVLCVGALLLSARGLVI